MKMNIGYACAIAALAIGGAACGTAPEGEAVGLGRMTTSSAETAVVESEILESAIVEPVEANAPSATEAPAVEQTEPMDADLAALSMDIAWEGMSADDRSDFCQGLDLFGVTRAGKIFSEGSGGVISATQAGELMQEKCAGDLSSGSADDDVASMALDLVWDSMDAAGQAGMCDATDMLGAEEAGAIIAESSGGIVTEAEAAAFVIEKCM